MGNSSETHTALLGFCFCKGGVLKRLPMQHSDKLHCPLSAMIWFTSEEDPESQSDGGGLASLSLLTSELLTGTRLEIKI